MLLLSRKEEDTIVIDKDIVVKVVKIERGRVTIGIDAPDNVEILRGELLERDSSTKHRIGKRHT
ncbi:hypothetical protein LCGC14_1597180 [marine sediment metagenome]|uniref:Carbon storage regulator n=1 Tax=marine sediment metagenome TaxID=412755 RepID=A0A0F9KSV9_9ZZZZ